MVNSVSIATVVSKFVDETVSEKKLYWMKYADDNQWRSVTVLDHLNANIGLKSCILVAAKRS